jgi:DNA-binding XRE family transcriptional regulator
MKARVFYGGKELGSADLYRLIIQADGKAWRYDHHTATEMRFTVVPLGYAGTANWLKQWRARGKYNQTKAARILGVSQSFVAKVEKGAKTMPEKMILKILEDIRKHGRNRIPPSEL